MHYYEWGLHICFLKILKHGALRKSEATQVFQNQRRKSSFRQKKLLLMLKILWTRRKLLFNILARLIDQYVAFCMHRGNVKKCPRKRSSRRFVRAVLDGRFKPSQIQFNSNLR